MYRKKIIGSINVVPDFWMKAFCEQNSHRWLKWNESQTLRWRHNGHDSVSNHQPHHCLLNRLFGCRSKKTSKLRVTGLCAGNSPGTAEFPPQMASNAENVSIWWRHHDKIIAIFFVYDYPGTCIIDFCGMYCLSRDESDHPHSLDWIRLFFPVSDQPLSTNPCRKRQTEAIGIHSLSAKLLFCYQYFSARNRTWNYHFKYGLITLKVYCLPFGHLFVRTQHVY